MRGQIDMQPATGSDPARGRAARRVAGPQTGGSRSERHNARSGVGIEPVAGTAHGLDGVAAERTVDFVA